VVLSTDTDLPIVQVAQLYLGLEIIERGWRELKSGLEVRPIRHRLERRIEAHLQLCALAYLLERVIELRIRARGHEFTGPRAIDEFGTIVLNDIELATTGWRRRVVTDMTDRQRALLGAIGVAGALFAVGPRTLD
jgi:transposase